MRKWLIVALLCLTIALPASAQAQGEVVLSSLDIQLLPEYDEPSMLVIYDFTISDAGNLPGTITMRIPLDANLFAVAYNQNGNLLNAEYLAPQPDGEWQKMVITTNEATVFRIEYYEPLSIMNAKRQFTYLWPGDYAVKSLSVFVSEPADLTQINTEPALEKTKRPDGLPGYGKKIGSFAAGKQFTLTLQYEKSSDALTVPPQDLQPSSPVDENTPGRISLTNYLPYIFGGLGVTLILGGAFYYWQTGRKSIGKPRRRRHIQSEEEESEMYCHQCGTRAKASDRFCRVCGSRLRQEE